eukprot:gene1390-813_t
MLCSALLIIFKLRCCCSFFFPFPLDLLQPTVCLSAPHSPTLSAPRLSSCAESTTALVALCREDHPDPAALCAMQTRMEATCPLSGLRRCAAPGAAGQCGAGEGVLRSASTAACVVRKYGMQSVFSLCWDSLPTVGLRLLFGVRGPRMDKRCYGVALYRLRCLQLCHNLLQLCRRLVWCGVPFIEKKGSIMPHRMRRQKLVYLFGRCIICYVETFKIYISLFILLLLTQIFLVFFFSLFASRDDDDDDAIDSMEEDGRTTNNENNRNTPQKKNEIKLNK